MGISHYTQNNYNYKTFYHNNDLLPPKKFHYDFFFFFCYESCFKVNTYLLQ